MRPRIVRLRGCVQHYEWGGYDYIPNLLGIPNEQRKPYAELWIGAHPSAPCVADFEHGVALDDVRGRPERVGPGRDVPGAERELVDGGAGALGHDRGSSLGEDDCGVAAVRSYTMMWKLFSSVTTTSLRIASTKIELNAGHGSLMVVCGGRAATFKRALAGGTCAANAAVGAKDGACGSAVSHSQVSSA